MPLLEKIFEFLATPQGQAVLISGGEELAKAVAGLLVILHKQSTSGLPAPVTPKA